ncbi:MAG: RNA 2',3'-cyclic phosphodiesterase [Deltaproteobacteria bacterium]|nr:RNA 2',3'-cyclic phosphodiesterase [Deltaproteobacteria bacterium]
MERIRSFIAIEVPQTLQARMGELQRELKRTEADVKWVRPEGIHLTLKFLGSISLEDIEKLTLAITPVVVAWVPFEMKIFSLGCFPSSRNPRVLWLGVDRGGPEVLSLQKAIENKAAEVGFLSETKPFKPHLTLGRVRSAKGMNPLIQAMEKHKDAEIGSFRVKEVHLFQSELKPSGAVHTKLRAFLMRENQE